MAVCKRRPTYDIFILDRNGNYQYFFESKETLSSCLIAESERVVPTVGKKVRDIMVKTQCEIYRKREDGSYEKLPEDLELPPGKYYLPA